MQEPRLLIESGQPGILLEIASNDFRGLLGKASAARFGEPLENINLNLDRPDDDRAEISQAVQAFTARRIQQRLEQTIEIPPLPQTAQKIIKLRVDPNASVDDITGLVETGSGARRPGGQLGGLALLRRAGQDPLGGRRDRPRPRFRPGDQPGPRPRPGQEPEPAQGPAAAGHALLAAGDLHRRGDGGLTRAMPRELRPESGLSYLGGLLHNFGYLVLAHVFPPHFSLICRHLEVNPHLGHAYIEQHLLGITREQIGAWLMRVWDMPDDLYCALRFQQDPSTGPNAVYANLICLTNRLLRNSGIGDGPQQAIPAALYERLGITPEKAGDAVKRCWKRKRPCANWRPSSIACRDDRVVRRETHYRKAAAAAG